MGLDAATLEVMISRMTEMRRLRERAGLSQEDLARAANTSQAQIARLETGARKMTKEWALKLAPPLRTTAEELLFGQQPNPLEPNATAPVPTNMDLRGAIIPVYGAAIGGDDGRFDFNGQEIDRVPAPPPLIGVRDAYAVYVVGESMEPRYYASEIVYVHPFRPVRRGDFVVIQIHQRNDGDAVGGMVKQYVTMTPSRLVVRQFNPDKEIEIDRATVKAVHRIVFSGSLG